MTLYRNWLERKAAARYRAVVKAPVPAEIRRAAEERGRVTYENRFPRYAANAELEQQYADRARSTWARSAGLYERAADNARDNSDEAAELLYREMADAALDAAEALADIADAARDVAAYYKGKLGATATRQ